MKLDRTARRILGSLLEKRWTTPDQFPLSLNALVSACNQKSNRDPVISLHEFEISGCLLQLRTRSLVMVHERDFGRVPRYSDRMAEETALQREELAILAELMLRGPQTPGELLRRCKRMAHYRSMEQIFDLLRGLAEGQYVKELPRGSREKYARWTHLLAPKSETEGETDEPAEDDVPHAEAAAVSTASSVTAPAAASASASASSAPTAAAGELAAQVVELREGLAALRGELAEVRERLDTLEGLI